MADDDNNDDDDDNVGVRVTFNLSVFLSTKLSCDFLILQLLANFNRNESENEN